MTLRVEIAATKFATLIHAAGKPKPCHSCDGRRKCRVHDDGDKLRIERNAYVHYPGNIWPHRWHFS